MNKTILYLLLGICIGGCAVQKKRLLGEVDPFIGTGFHGHTYPGATVPFGSVQLSPDTRRGNWDACAGYHYSDSAILGFSHTHLSGTGCIDLGDILFYPTMRRINPDRVEEERWPLPFSHRQEWAAPGYYKVVLPTENIQVELTATPYTGVHRYRMEKAGTVSLIIDLAHLLDNEQIKEATLEKTAENEISGMRCTQGWVDNQFVYFVARFSHPFDTLCLVDEERICRSGDRISGEKLQAIPEFSVEAGETIEVKVGLSSVSIENARQNLEHDVAGLNFRQVRRKAAAVWKQALSDIVVEGGKPEERRIFYTALYHSKIVPNLASDVNGEYRRHDLSVGQTVHGEKRYSTFSFWDTFRAWHPLTTLLDTAFVGEMIHSMLDMYDASGELPVWPLSAGETGTMIGYHSVAVIADAWMKGIRNFDGHKALEAMVRSAEKNKKGARYYIRDGYIPADSRKESVSCLLEFAYDDWCIARMAEALGEEEIAGRFARRARNYINVFDGSGRFFRGKRSDGNWETPFHPYEIGRSYTEATAWQYRFFVPHDVDGMIQLYGGRENFLQDLDSLFATTSEMEGTLSDVTGLIGQYAQGNEPSHHIAYLYSYAGEPWKTQAMIGRIRNEMYRNDPEGICGNEDCGQMSAWYILSSLGFYPVCPGSNEFILTSPLFPKATLKLANGKKLVVTANRPDRNQYIRKVSLNEREIDRVFLTYDELMEGGKLTFELSDVPDHKWAVGTTLPYSMSCGPQVSVPYCSEDLYLFENEITFRLGCATEGTEIRYTLDGSEPDGKAPLYTTPLRIDRSCTLKAKGFKTGYAPSEVLALQAVKAEYLPADTTGNRKEGVKYRYYEGKFTCVADMEKIQPSDSGYMQAPDISRVPREDHYGYIWDGWIYVPANGVYEFQTKSDDGSVLYIGERKVVDNDGSHGAVAAFGRIALEKGYHSYRLLFFEDYEGQMLEWKFQKL